MLPKSLYPSECPSDRNWFTTTTNPLKRKPASNRNDPALLSTKRMLFDLGDHPAVVSSQDPPLFYHKLPRELCDQIYDILWQNVILGFRQENFIVLARYKSQDIDLPSYEFPRWLHVSGQMRSESGERFYATALFSVGETDCLPAYGHRFFSTTSKAWTSVVSAYIDTRWSRKSGPVTVFTIKRICSDLLDLRYAKHMKVLGLELTLDVDREKCARPYAVSCFESCCERGMKAVITPPADCDFTRLLSLLDYKPHDCRSLELIITPTPFRWGRDVVTDITYDWSFFDSLPQEGCICSVSVDGDDENWTFSSAAPALAEARRKCADFSS